MDGWMDGSIDRNATQRETGAHAPAVRWCGTHSSATLLMRRHMLKMCSSDWITFGPAIRKKGLAPCVAFVTPSGCAHAEPVRVSRSASVDPYGCRAQRITRTHLELGVEGALIVELHRHGYSHPQV